jgi:hypothetical protein
MELVPEEALPEHHRSTMYQHLWNHLQRKQHYMELTPEELAPVKPEPKVPATVAWNQHQRKPHQWKRTGGTSTIEASTSGTSTRGTRPEEPAEELGLKARPDMSFVLKF